MASRKSTSRRESVSRFVDMAATVEIPLANGDKVWVRERLTAVEQARLTKSLIKVRFDPVEGKIQMDEGDWHLQQVAVVKAYLTGWDFTNGVGDDVPFSTEAIECLDTETVHEIAFAVDLLQKAQAEAREKKGGKTSMP